MRNILTAKEIEEYNKQGIKDIVLQEMPLITEVANEMINRYNMKIVVTNKQDSNSINTLNHTDNCKTTRRLSDMPISMERPPFKEVIKSNKKITGMFVSTPHQNMTEFLGRMGLDFLTIDSEHNAMHLETVQRMLQSMASTPTYGMVRVPTISYAAISGALDIGADALLIPQIRTVDDINRIKEYSLYPPNGKRGAGPSRATNYGSNIMDLSNNPDKKTNIVVQIETVKALENIDSILDNDFIDMYFIGPGDLSMDMGIFGQNSNPKLVEAIMMVRDKTFRAGKKLGIFAGDFDAAKNWYAKGFDMTIINSELGYLGAFITQGLKKLNSNSEV